MNTKQATATGGIAKLSTGIAGLDNLLAGGIPERRITLVQGEMGTGKTILAMQALSNHVREGGTGVVIAFEEQSDELLENLAGFDWNPGAGNRERMFFIDARLDDYLISGEDFDISGLLAAVGAKLEGDAPRWLVLDGRDSIDGNCTD